MADSHSVAFGSYESPWERRVFPVFLLILWASLYVVDLGTREFVHEEGRRAISAREMWEQHDYLVPRVLNQTYLNKPPGFPGLILLVSSVGGEINEWTVRWVSSLATGFTALLIYLFARNGFSHRVCFVAAALFLLTLMTLEKGRLGEIEAVFTTAVWASMVCAWNGLRTNRSWKWWALSGVCLGLAVLLKGPPALVFFYGTLLFYCLQSGHMRWFLSLGHALAIGIAGLIFFAWLIPTLERVGWTALIETGTREMLQRGGYGAADFFAEHASLITGAFAGFLPGSLLTLAYFWRRRWWKTDEDVDLQVFLLCMITSATFFFLFFPGARARYLYPIAPAFAILGALVWMQAQERAVLHWIATLFFVILGVMGIAAIGTIYGLSALLSTQILQLMGMSILCLGLVIGLRMMWSRRFSFPAIVLQLTLLWMVSYTGVLARDSKYRLQLPIKQSAMLASTYVPDGQTLYTLSWSEFNLFYYVKNPVRYIPSLQDLERNGEERYVAFRFFEKPKEFDRWEILDFEVIPLSVKECMWIVKIR